MTTCESLKVCTFKTDNERIKCCFRFESDAYKALGICKTSECLCSQETILHRKEVIQPHLPIRLPCYDFTPIIYPTFGGCFLAVSPPTSGVVNSRGVTGGVYKTRERIHRGMLIRDY